MQFSYAVYLLNKNVAQLRWYFGYKTTDLRATLPNLETLFSMHSMQKRYEYSDHILDRGYMCCSNFEIFFDSDIKDSRFTSGGISNLSSISRNSVQYSSLPSRFNLNKNEKLSYSLDRGLDQWNQKDEKDPTQNTSEPAGHSLSADSTDQDAYESANSVLSTVTQSAVDDSHPSIDS